MDHCQILMAAMAVSIWVARYQGKDLRMYRILLRRSFELLIALFAVSIIIFCALHLAPGDPLDTLFEGRARTPEAVAAVNEMYHLDKPLPVQYGLWLKGVLSGDLGRSITFSQDVSKLVASHSATSALLIAYTMVLVVVVGMALGIISARRPGTVDRLLLVLTAIATASPSFVAAVVLIAVFAVSLKWFPTFGRGEGLLDQLYHLTLPAIALATTHVGLVARVTRMSILKEMAQPHVDVARSRGVSERTILWRHVLRNAFAPIMSVIATRVGSLIGGTTVIETAFGISGLGSLLVRSVTSRDFPVVQAITLIIVTVFIVALLLTDITQVRLDPRMDLEGAGQAMAANGSVVATRARRVG